MRRPQKGPVAIDDMTGFKVDHAKLKRQWDGALTVNPDKRNSQDFAKTRKERPQITDPRPEAADVFTAVNILWEDGLTPIINPDGSALMSEGPLNGEGI